MQCDSSKDGIGDCLLQGHTVSFVSKNCIYTEKNYGKIGKCIVFTFKNYHNFVYRHKVVVQSKHKTVTEFIENLKIIY